MEGVELVFEEESLEVIVDKALKRNTGARGLRSIMESEMLEIMYSIPSMKNIERCVITKETIEDNAPPVYEKRKASA